MIYDIIGDIHGQADKLIGLLYQLGYHHDGQSFVAPHGHQAIFIGDFLDRGNRQLDTLKIVFDMLDDQQALAIMGNHEYNALAYATKHHHTDEYLRPHTPHNTAQHQAFLDEVCFGTDLHQYWLNRLYELPLWLELDTLICVHACFDKRAMDCLSSLLDNNCLTPEILHITSTPQSSEFVALERLLKGIEMPLPEGISMTDKTGIIRQQARVKWWINNWQQKPINTTLFADNLPAIKPTHLSKNLLGFDIDTPKPIFIGHYWLDGTPRLRSYQAACVDYSAGKDGFLTAYQFDTNHPTLNHNNFVQFIDDL